MTPIQQNSANSEAADLFDYQQIQDYFGFVIGAMRRHALLAAIVFGSIVGVGLLSLWLLPKSYKADSRILAQRNQVMSSIANPGRTIPWDADAPTRAAQETVFRRDNLISLIKQTNLIDQWEANRAPLTRIKDFFRNLFLGQPDEEVKLDALVGLLEKRLQVTIGEGTLTIEIEWPDPQMAFRLVEAAQQNFLEARHAMEVSNISEAISILEAHAANVHDGIQATINEMQSAARAKTSSATDSRPTPALPRVAAVKRSPADQEISRLKVMLEAKRRTIGDLEDSRRQRLAQLHSQLTEAKATYAAAHPIILNIEESIKAFSRESPQIANAKREEEELLEEYEAARREAIGRDLTDPGPALSAPERIQQVRRDSSDDDRGFDYQRTQLRIATGKYEELLGRIDAARIELDTARAAFKYRYSVVRPAQVPKNPEKPKPALVMGASLIAGAFLSILAAGMADLRKGRIVESWQIERSLKLPVLAEVKWT